MGPRNEYHQTKQEALTHLGQKQTQANTKASGHYKNFLALKKLSRLSYALHSLREDNCIWAIHDSPKTLFPLQQIQQLAVSLQNEFHFNINI